MKLSTIYLPLGILILSSTVSADGYGYGVPAPMYNVPAPMYYGAPLTTGNPVIDQVDRTLQAIMPSITSSMNELQAANTQGYMNGLNACQNGDTQTCDRFMQALKISSNMADNTMRMWDIKYGPSWVGQFGLMGD